MSDTPPDRIAAASQAFRAARREGRRQRRHRERLDVSMRVLEAMLEELEQMNLQGTRRVPIEFEARIQQLAEVFPTEGGDLPPMRSQVAPARLIDMVFEVQDRLLDARAGRSRRLDDEVA